MEQDLRKLFEVEREKRYTMKDGHEQRFLQKLDEELPNSRSSRFPIIWSIAASIVILIGVGLFLFRTESVVPANNSVAGEQEQVAKEGISLGDLSPDLAKVEEYYMANINMELSRLEVSEENKELVDSYLEQLAALNQEYSDLNRELNTFGPNDQTITALIKNLQLRLQLLLKLKEKLNQIKSSKNEQLSSNHV